MKKRAFIGLNMLTLSLVSSAAFGVDTNLSIYPEQTRQKVTFGGDIKLTVKKVDEGNTLKIMQRFVELGFDTVRVPFFPIRDIDDPFYSKVYRVSDIAEDMGLKVFASVANGDGEFNNWLHGAHKFAEPLICPSCDANIYHLNLTAYASYLDAYINQMAEHDAKVDYFGPFNEDRASVSDYQKLWAQMDEGDFLRVGPELWGLGNSVNDTPGLAKLIDVVGAHFYDDESIPIAEHDSRWSELKTAALAKPVWFTEATRFEATNNEMSNLRLGLEHIIPAIRGGADKIIFYQAANRFVWYNGGKRAYRFTGVKQFTTQARGVVVNSTIDDLAMKTVSFLEKDVLTINVTNGHDTAKLLTVNIEGEAKAFGSGQQTFWTEHEEASLNGLTYDGAGCLTITVPPNAYMQLSIPIAKSLNSDIQTCQHNALPNDGLLPDFDEDGVADYFDDDDDGDEIADIDDAFPFDASQWGDNNVLDDQAEQQSEQNHSGGSLGWSALLFLMVYFRRKYLN